MPSPSPRVASPAVLVLLALAAGLAGTVAGGRAPATAAPFDERLATCLACHGASGRSPIPDTPSLGGQPAFFVIAQLFLFREGRRGSAVMTEAARGLTDDDLRAFGDAVSRLPPPSRPADPPDPARMARAQALLRRHPCGVCHNPDFSGRDQMPRLAHQDEAYLLRAMREYRSGARIGYGGAMATELVGLSDADLADLAHFLARLPP
jgi:cytochrome c553